MYNIPEFILTKVVKLKLLVWYRNKNARPFKNSTTVPRGSLKNNQTYFNVGSLNYWYDFVSVQLFHDILCFSYDC